MQTGKEAFHLSNGPYRKTFQVVSVFSSRSRRCRASLEDSEAERLVSSATSLMQIQFIDAGLFQCSLDPDILQCCHRQPNHGVITDTFRKILIQLYRYALFWSTGSAHRSTALLKLSYEFVRQRGRGTKRDRHGKARNCCMSMCMHRFRTICF